MDLSEPFPKSQVLTRAEKLPIIQALVNDLAREEDCPEGVICLSLPVWSPYDAFDAAKTMLAALNRSEARE